MSSKSKSQDYKPGTLETQKFSHRKEDFYTSQKAMLEMGYETEDFLHHFPAFVGHMTLWRFLTLYELYKKTTNLAGHIADIGVHKVASALLFTKLTQIYEPESLTQVHGFDWFKGTKASTEDAMLIDGTYAEDEQRLRTLVEIQKLDHILKIHALDLTKDTEAFFSTHPHLQFKLVFCDSGTYDVTSSAIRNFWPRLVPGGLMIFDQFNHETSPGETRAVRELLPDMKIETIPGAWMPNAFIQKPYK